MKTATVSPESPAGGGPGAARRVEAQGTGVIHFEGSGSLSGCSRRADIVVAGSEQQGIGECRGRMTLKSGAVRFTGVRGRFAFSGSELVVTIEGEEIALAGEAAGDWRLRGCGCFRDGDAERQWDIAGGGMRRIIAG